jgi:hypothetical protein
MAVRRLGALTEEETAVITNNSDSDTHFIDKPSPPE